MMRSAGVAGQEIDSAGGRASAAPSRSEAQQSGAVLLDVADLTKHFGPVRAVEDLSFQVHRGEIVGLLGPNGAGKTTAMRMLVGFLIPTRGSVRLAGGDVFREGPRLKRRLGYLPENMPLYGEMTVREYLRMVGQLRGLDRQTLAAGLDALGATLGLAPMWGRPTSQLSRGFRQRVGLAQCLLGDPEILILDEPGTGLDPNQMAELRNLIRTWRQRKAILLSTHILSEAQMLCDRVLILSRGRLTAAGRPQALAESGEERLTMQIRVRGSGESPLAGLTEYPGLSATRMEALGAEATWRLEGELDRGGRLALATHLSEAGWEILEWNSGLGALEQAFRRLTIERRTPPGEEE
jgi:ABC-2 type transport system ATP-binding protein